jgi:cephalosporin hydroxylase
MNQHDQFMQEVRAHIEGLGRDADLQSLSRIWLREITPHKYSYNFTWMGRPIIQLPQDILALQQLIWAIQPDLIIETGIAHGGSLIFSASMLELNAQCGGPQNARVLGVDIDIRAHNREAIEAHPMSRRVQMIQGSSIDPTIIEQVRSVAHGKQRVLVCLDSNHTHEHVLAELQGYAPLVSVGSYCIVFDTLIEDMPDNLISNRPWGRGNNPKTAVWEYLRRLKETPPAAGREPPMFEIDKSIEHSLLLTVAPDGYLRRVS